MSLGETPLVITLTGSVQRVSAVHTDYTGVTIQAFDSPPNTANVFLQFSPTTPGSITQSTCNYELPALGSITLEPSCRDAMNGETVNLYYWWINGTSGNKLRISGRYNYDSGTAPVNV